VLITSLTTRFGLDLPLVSAPMAGASGGALAAAVCAAGGLGMIGIGSSTPPSWITENGTVAGRPGRPYGAGLLAWSRPEQSGQLDAVLALDPPPALVSVSYGSPAGDERRLLAPLREAGCVVATQVGNATDARRAVDDGFDILVVRGGEGGGHGRNQVGTLPLLQRVLDLVPTSGPRPLVLAAGGISGPRGLAAVLAAGADGAWVGTAFLACPEATTAEAARERLLAADTADTVYTAAFDRGFGLGWPDEFAGRALRNRFTERWTGSEQDLVGPVGEKAREELAGARAARDFDVDHVYAGQGVGALTRSRPAAEVVASFARAEDLLSRWASDAGRDPGTDERR
jgi:nitronate monooxygenase